MRSDITIFLLLFLLFEMGTQYSTYAQCNDLSVPDGLVQYTGSEYDFLKSIGRFANGCTGTFIRTSLNPDAPAYVLTNGHCVSEIVFQNPNTTLTDYTMISEDRYVEFNYFQNTQSGIIQVDIANIEYASMKGADIAIARLDKTIGEMAELGLLPISISDEIVGMGDTVKIPGTPVGSFLRMTSGRMTGQSAVVVENGWVWYDVFENDCDNISPGSSGSPVFSCFDDGFYGIINTTNAGAIDPCVINSPCEVSSRIPELDTVTNYVIDVRNVLQCFNEDGFFDMSLEDFPLNTENAIHAEFGIIRGMISYHINPDLPERDKTISVDLSGKNYYRYKFVSLENSLPRSIADYSDVISSDSLRRIVDSIPSEEGLYILSVIGGDTPIYDESWQSVQEPTNLVVVVDKTPPTVIADIVENSEENDSMYNIFVDNIELNLFYPLYVGYGDLSFDENDLDNYPPILFDRVRIPKSEGPYKVCAFFTDLAGNRGPISCKIYGETTSVNHPNIAAKLSLYPNPTSDFLLIEAPSPLQVERASLFNLFGAMVYHFSRDSQELDMMDVRGLSPGIYYLHLVTNQGSAVKKIIIH